MAESADVLAQPHQTVVLPDLKAGCSMADMATLDDVEDAWDQLLAEHGDTFTPITYMNSSAAIKGFCGARGGIVCTSSNARAALDWAWARKPRVLFLPDQHLGRNTAMHGRAVEHMAEWTGGRRTPASERARSPRDPPVLWRGFCRYTKFDRRQIDELRAEDPRSILAPECPFDVVRTPTSWVDRVIIDQVRAAKPGASWAIGTEIHLAPPGARAPEQRIRSLQKNVPLCAP
jgi:quinolinate synthase